MQIDAGKIGDSLPYLHLTWSGPMLLVAATFMLYHYLVRVRVTVRVRVRRLGLGLTLTLTLTLTITLTRVPRASRASA